MEVPILRIPYSEEDISFIKTEIEAVLRSGFLTMADRVHQFEKEFAQFCGVKYAVGTNSGTSALEMILRAIDVNRKTVIVPANTYMATALAAIKAGARIIFVDCEINNLQMDPDDLRKKVRKDTQAVVLVHIGGMISSRLEEIKGICKAHNLYLIEDAAHAHGAEIDGQKAGSLGIAGSFSFYPTKVLTTAEGGMLTTNDEEIYQKALILREHGKSDHRFNVHTEVGDNWRFSEIHAVLGLQQMKKADWILSERRKIASFYDSHLNNVNGIRKLVIPGNVKSSYYKYVLFLDRQYDRHGIKKQMLDDCQISLPGEVYSHPCHTQPLFEKYPDLVVPGQTDHLPNTEYVCRRQICLPLYPGMTRGETTFVCDSLKKVIRSSATPIK